MFVFQVFGINRVTGKEEMIANLADKDNTQVFRMACAQADRAETTHLNIYFVASKE
jgi:hypothetical protein